jgi:hypothetical protein
MIKQRRHFLKILLPALLALAVLAWLAAADRTPAPAPYSPPFSTR